MSQASQDEAFMERALALALAAEEVGNLPVGAVLVLDDAIVAEGASAILVPRYDPIRHAELEAIRATPPGLWPRAAEMTCYTTLEPCTMCFGALLLHGVGRVVFGARDVLGGAGVLLDHLPPYYRNLRAPPRWDGPVAPERCDPLYERAHTRFAELACG